MASMAGSNTAEQKETGSTASELRFARLPDDLHHHFRDGQALTCTVPAVARCFSRAIAMPNLKPPVVTTEDALAYYERIKQHVPEGNAFEPLMTLYLTDQTTPEEVAKAKATGKIVACKLYPAGATTNSDSGVTDINKVLPTLRKMAEIGMLLLIHGEVTHHDVDVFDKEAVFIREKMEPLVQAIPTLKIVMEHVTTAEAVAFVNSHGDNIAATITPQHLLFNRNAIFNKGVRPHMYCLPILKREKHRLALLEAVKSGSRKFFLGTDSAPHEKGRKESACGCAGIFSALAALELYATAFETVDSLSTLEAFACENGADFYGMPRNDPAGGSIVLRREPWTLPAEISFDGGVVVPLYAGEQIEWRAERA